MDRVLIERAIESAKARIYKLSVDEKRNPSAGHQRKIERQKEVAEITVQALERMLPKKPTDKTAVLDDRVYVGDIGKCPNCEHIVSEDDACCRDCHQVLDWSE